MVMGDDSCSRGCWFESRHLILDGHDIFTLICCKSLFEKSYENRPWLAHLKNLKRDDTFTSKKDDSKGLILCLLREAFFVERISKCNFKVSLELI